MRGVNFQVLREWSEGESELAKVGDTSENVGHTSPTHAPPLQDEVCPPHVLCTPLS